MKKKDINTVKTITLFVLIYILFLKTNFSQKIKMLVALLFLTLFAYVNIGVYMFIVLTAFVTLIFNTYQNFSIDIKGITNKIVAWTNGTDGTDGTGGKASQTGGTNYSGGGSGGGSR